MLNGLDNINYNHMNGLFEINAENVNTSSITTDIDDIDLLDDSTSLNIYGKMNINKRNIHLYDNVIIEGNINCKGSINLTLSSYIYSKMPVFSVIQNTLNFNELPTVSINNNNLAAPIITFSNPQQTSFSTRCFTISGASYVNQYIESTAPNVTLLDFYNTCPYFKIANTYTISSYLPASVTIDNSTIYYPELSFNIPRGEKGIQGIQGNTPTFNISNIYTISSYLNASVDIDNTNIIYPSLSFSLPRGKTPIFDIGYVNTISSYLSPSVFIDNSLIENPKLNFNFPRGEKGKDAVTPQFSIKNVGTVSELLDANVILYDNGNNVYGFDFQIPRGLPGIGFVGPKGDKGDKGNNGDATGATIAAGVAGGLAAGATAAAVFCGFSAASAAAAAASASASAATCTTLFTDMSTRTKFLSTNTILPENPIIDSILIHRTYLDSSLSIKSGANTVLTYLSNTQRDASKFFEMVDFGKIVNFYGPVVTHDGIQNRGDICTNFIKHLPYSAASNGNKNQDINIGVEKKYGDLGISLNEFEATNNINITGDVCLIIGSNKVTINSRKVIIEALEIEINGSVTFNGPVKCKNEAQFLGPTFIILDPPPPQGLNPGGI